MTLLLWMKAIELIAPSRKKTVSLQCMGWWWDWGWSSLCPIMSSFPTKFRRVLPPSIKIGVLFLTPPQNCIVLTFFRLAQFIYNLFFCPLPISSTWSLMGKKNQKLKMMVQISFYLFLIYYISVEEGTKIKKKKKNSGNNLLSDIKGKEEMQSWLACSFTSLHWYHTVYIVDYYGWCKL